MLLMAPTTNQDRTCIAGRLCAFPITGKGLAETDRFLVMDTCGATQTVPYFGNPGFGAPAYIALESAMVSWGNNLAPSAAGGEYRLCWCSRSVADPRPCDFSEDFKVDVGNFLLLGPSPTLVQDRTCVSGQTCLLDDITGAHFNEADYFTIFETCGTAVQPARLVTRAWSVTAIDQVYIYIYIYIYIQREREICMIIYN